MKDRPNVSLWSDIVNAFKGELGSITGAPTQGIFIAFEGGEGIGKSTQANMLKQWLEQEGESVVLSREPGGTDLGIEIRKFFSRTPPVKFHHAPKHFCMPQIAHTMFSLSSAQHLQMVKL